MLERGDSILFYKFEIKLNLNGKKQYILASPIIKQFGTVRTISADFIKVEALDGVMVTIPNDARFFTTDTSLKHFQVKCNVNLDKFNASLETTLDG